MLMEMSGEGLKMEYFYKVKIQGHSIPENKFFFN